MNRQNKTYIAASVRRIFGSLIAKNVILALFALFVLGVEAHYSDAYAEPFVLDCAGPTPSNNNVTSPFGLRHHPIHGTNRPHTGVDYGTPIGTAINIPPGTGTCRNDPGGYGQYLVVDHGNGVETRYAHLSSCTGGANPSAVTGNTGGSTGPHLHYETRINGNPVDPEAACGLDLTDPAVQECLNNHASFTMASTSNRGQRQDECRGENPTFPPTATSTGDGSSCTGSGTSGGDYYDALAQSESGGCGGGDQYCCQGPVITSGIHAGDRPLGKYQFMPKTLDSMGISREGFLCNGPAQEAAIRQFTENNRQCLQNCGAMDHIGQQRGGCTLTESGLLGAAHLGGCGGACNYAKSGVGPSDQLGTSLGDYACKFADDGFGQCDPLPIGTDFIETQVIMFLSGDIHMDNIHWFMRNNWIMAFMMMTEQFVVTMMQQILAIGMFFDADIQLDTQLLFQELEARAHKDYHPSHQMCVVGSNVRGLLNASFAAEKNAIILNTMLQDREILARGMASAAANENVFADYNTRMAEFKRRYCTERENDGIAEFLECNASDPGDVGQDVSYSGTIENTMTLDMDLVAGTGDDIPEIIALGKNLFNESVQPPVQANFYEEDGFDTVFHDMRSITAMRSVARQSFSTIVGMRAKSPRGSDIPKTMNKIVESLGVPPAEVEAFLGEDPSYYAQMELMTNKLYQTPDFFTNLYDKPANLKRMRATLKAIELMQNRDRYETALRKEMLVSLLLEAKIRAYEESIESRLYSTLKPHSGIPVQVPTP